MLKAALLPALTISARAVAKPPDLPVDPNDTIPILAPPPFDLSPPAAETAPPKPEPMPGRAWDDHDLTPATDSRLFQRGWSSP